MTDTPPLQHVWFCAQHAAFDLLVILILVIGLNPAVSAADVSSSSLTHSTAAIHPTSLQFSAYNMRPLYTNESDDVDWQQGLRASGTWAFARQFAASFACDTRVYREVEEGTSHTRFPRDLELGLIWGEDLSSSAAIITEIENTVIVPIDETRSKQESYRGSYRIAPRITLYESVLGRETAFASGASWQKNLHEYEQTIVGDQNTNFESTVFLSVVFKPYTNLSLSILGEHLWSALYNGRIENTYVISNGIELAVQNGISIGVGHINKSNTLSADQRSSNISLISSDRSLIFASVGFQTSQRRLE